MTLEQLLRLGALYDADKGGQGGEGATGEGEGEGDKDGGTGGDNTGDDPGKKDDEPKFTQEQVNAFIQDRLARERKKQEDKQKEERDEAERERLKEEQKYKDLADKLQEQLDEQKKLAQSQQKEALLVSAGYTEEQVGLLKELVKGESVDDMKTSIEELKKTFSPKPDYVDPSAGNGKKGKPEKKDGSDVGKSAYERLKDLGKIRRK